MKPIENARPFATLRVTPLQPVARSGAARTPGGSAAPTPAPADAMASIAAQLSAAGEVPVDAARVGAIRDAIRRGDYSLDAGEIADAMIAAGHLKRATE
ncbi:flagellar biosynthesis anti-sigma factor FlgM [Croceibacterium ferulae]|uniref:flagellar biosynthesis anti-sigma factor FlgM n=1 Tax=Croceibacterium ferulae TaxID=1854641 RepID=UPI000EB1C82C|nr:flagellar biosynthesis anti-sigma factor FlgM [Croceibacterium ferulae]